MNNIIHSKYKRINIVSAQYLPPHILVYLEWIRIMNSTEFNIFSLLNL
jgi:hypothetical protein